MSKLLNLEKLSAKTRSIIRKEQGVRTFAQLVEKAENEGKRLGRGDERKLKAALKYYGEQYNKKILLAREVRKVATKAAYNERRREARALTSQANIQRAQAATKIASIIRERRALRSAIVIDVHIGHPDQLNPIFNYLYKQRGKTILIHGYYPSFLLFDNEIHWELPLQEWLNYHNITEPNFNKVFYIPTEHFRKWWGKARWYFLENSIWVKHGKYVFTPEQLIPEQTIFQKFAEGVTNCLLTPILSWATNIDVKSLTAKKRYTKIANDVTEYMNKYTTGIPEDIIPEICNKLQVDITIESPFNTTPLFECQSTKKRLRKFKFINTRINHVDLNEITICDTPINVTHEELKEIKAKLDSSNTYYTCKMNLRTITSLSTLTHTYSVSSEFSTVVADFERDTGLNLCKIDDFDQKELSEFIREGTNYNGTIDFGCVEDVNGNENHIDMAKAYANFKTCEHYSGFLGKITDFRLTDKIQGVGLYRITDLNLDNCSSRFCEYNKKMKIYLSNNVYCSPELDMLTKYGATFKIVSGCWGVKTFEFEFNDAMLNGKDDGTSYYARWTGLIDSHLRTRNIFIPCTSDFYSIVHHNANAPTKFFGNLAMVSYPKTHNYHLGHIAAFITSYQRISVIDQLNEIDPSNVLRVCVDGIYFYGDVPKLKNVFRVKSERKFGNVAGNSYVSSARKQDLLKTISGNDWGDKYSYKENRETNKPRDSFPKELHLGAGGSGKTHFNCTDKGLVRPLFVAPSWKLARSKQIELGLPCTVWARVITSDPEAQQMIRERANVLIFDEVSMMSEDSKKTVFALYPNLKLIFCGDLGFQLPCITGIEMKKNGFDNIVRHTTDHRCRDTELRDLKNTLRHMIETRHSTRDINQWTVNYFTERERVLKFENIPYEIQDMILSGTNELKDKVTSHFAGKFSSEKYFVTENNRLHQNGEIIISDEKPDCRCEPRHCFTVHSIQGETAHSNLYIDPSKMFDPRMFYTAISRAKRLDQIWLFNF